MTSKTEFEPHKFLLSILIDKYDPAALEALLTSIFSQQSIPKFEIILTDNDTSGMVWEIGNRYALRHPGSITLMRNAADVGPHQNLTHQLHMARGKFYLRLAHTQEFFPAKILDAIAQLEADPLFAHAFIGRVSERSIPRQAHILTQTYQHTGKPLVSICIYNYNYGRFLAQCLESVAAQTYDNIEICFSDNASADSSWQIAQNFAAHYPGRMNLVRNRENFGATANLSNTRRNAQGKYLLLLCSDDAIKPDYVERCVALLERHPDASFAIVHRQIMDEVGNRHDEAPFYDKTCVIPGEEQAAVYMMAAVTPSISQVFYNHERMKNYALPHNFMERWFGQRLMDFYLCLDSPIVYIKEPLLLNRIHSASDGIAIDNNLVQGVGQYMLALQFAEMAESYGLTKPKQRLNVAIEKVGRICLRYCSNFLSQDNETTALRYFHLAQALFPGIVTDENFIRLKTWWETDAAEVNTKQQLLAALSEQADLTTRRVSYAPPPGSLPC
ncbi:MAG: glycosyltransferase [Betaproteobacteria bacterium]|jgi:glycosyltransferase involved in cell wall biosynthesis|nr:glycosyltransferase [Betaproteobacteria bacterium]